MWYNLAHSYPEPATYFDNHLYLNQLFAPVRVPFSRKNQEVSTVWIISKWWVLDEASDLRRRVPDLSSNAYNGRHMFVKQLMSHMRIDSVGACLKNLPKESQKPLDRKSNAAIYASYKFVIAIENSNCEDFVTEKFVDAIASTAIPIVASQNHKPDYLRFAPRYSFINIYDYKSVEELANYLHYLSANETAYNKYLWYRPQPKGVWSHRLSSRSGCSRRCCSHLGSGRDTTNPAIARGQSTLGERNTRWKRHHVPMVTEERDWHQ